MKLTTCNACGRTFLFPSRARSNNHTCLNEISTGAYRLARKKVKMKNGIKSFWTIRSIVKGYYEVEIKKNGQLVWALFDEKRIINNELAFVK